MLATHRTKDGNKMLVAEMTDEHLLNTIHLVLDSALRTKGSGDPASAMSDFQASMYGIERVDSKKAGELVRAAVERLYPYLSELFLRQFTITDEDYATKVDKAHEKLVSLLGRHESLAPKPMIPAFSEPPEVNF